MKVANLTRGFTLVENGEIASNLWARARGLLGHAPLRAGQGMLITPCHSIHTWFMSFAIDVAFLDIDNRIVHVIPDMPPGRVSPHLFRAQSVLELPARTLSTSGTVVGDQLAVQP